MHALFTSKKFFAFPSFFLTVAVTMLAVALGAGSSYATVGDTSAQIRGKYGAGRNVKPGMVYGIDDDAYSLTIYFLGDISVMEIYSKAKSRSGVAYPLNGHEIIRFMQANGNGYKWLPVEFKGKSPRNPDTHFWYRTDRKIIASYSRKEGVLTFRPFND